MSESELAALAESMQQEAPRAREAALTVDDLRVCGVSPEQLRASLRDLLTRPERHRA